MMRKRNKYIVRLLCGSLLLLVILGILSGVAKQVSMAETANFPTLSVPTKQVSATETANFPTLSVPTKQVSATETANFPTLSAPTKQVSAAKSVNFFVLYESANAEEDLASSVEGLMGNLDLSSLDAFLEQLTATQRQLFDGNFIDKVAKIVSGEIAIDYNNFAGFVFSLIGIDLLSYIPTIVSIIAIALSFNIISAIKGKFASESIETIAFFACMSAITIILLSQLYVIVGEVSSLITSLQTQMNLAFPLLLTLMTAIGAGSSVAVYQPSVALLTTSMVDMLVVVVLPIFIFSFIFEIVGSLSEGVKLKKMSDFFSSSSKWLIGTSFFLFLAFLSVQGITASIYDGISIRTAKFAISKYIPIIGGYLSEGFNLVVAGSVLIKNGLGLSMILLLVTTILPVVIQIIVFSLSLKLCSAIIEPLGDSRLSNMISNVGKSLSMLIVIIFAVAFLYFIFLMLIICTGNILI